MRYFSYRNKLRLRSLAITLLIALAILLALAAGIILYLQRYIVYTPDGAHLDFSSRPGAGTANDVPGNPNFDVEQITPRPDAEIEVNEAPEHADSAAFSRISGVYVTADMLSDPAAVLASLSQTTEPTAVLLDVKSIYGNYYYSSAIGGAEASALVDPSAVDHLISTLAGQDNLYLIARFPAFRDSAFALANQACGLPLSSGALWMDSDSCYWLDPSDDKVVAHLESMVLELQSMGFDEVVLEDFYFPDSANIVYEGDRSTAAADAAARLAANLQNEPIVLSIATSDPALAPYAARVYVTEADGARVQSIAQAFGAVYSPLEEHLVFVTDSRDTRFSRYGLLRPALEPAGD